MSRGSDEKMEDGKKEFTGEIKKEVPKQVEVKAAPV
jgi:hypothetical protein